MSLRWEENVSLWWEGIVPSGGGSVRAVAIVISCNNRLLKKKQEPDALERENVKTKKKRSEHRCRSLRGQEVRQDCWYCTFGVLTIVKYAKEYQSTIVC